MFLLKQCPNCGKKIRFPINKGKIKVNCKCGYKFYADPDNPDLYKDGQIDASFSASPKKNINVNSKKIINKLYDFYYQLLNFRLLTLEDKKIVLYKLVILTIIILLVVVFIVIPKN